MRCGWAKRTSSPIAGPGRVHAPVPPTIKGPNRPTCSVRSAPNAEPAPPSCCRPATPKLCSFTSMRSQPKSLRALTLLSSSIKPGGMAPRPSRFQTTSRSCSFRHAHLNSTAKKISGNSCGRTGCRTEFSNPSTISSTTAATLGTRSSTSPGRSCPSPDATGQQSVTQTEDWYYTSQQGNGFRDAGRKRSICQRLRLLRLDTRELHHLSPFLSFLGDELGEVGRRAGKYFTAEFRHSRRHHRLGERPVDLPIEPLDDLARGALGNANAEEAGHRVARDNIANHWNVRQHPQARLPRHAKRAQRTRLDMRYCRADGVEHRVHVAGHQCRMRGRRTPIGHVHHVDPGHHPE